MSELFLGQAPFLKVKLLTLHKHNDPNTPGFNARFIEFVEQEKNAQIAQTEKKFHTKNTVK